MAQVSQILNLKELPAILKSKKFKDYSLKDQKFIGGMLLIKEIVQVSYQKQARLMQETIREKRKHGYCGGFIYCLEYSGKEYMCPACKRQKDHPKYSRRQSPYGKIRQMERAKARAK